MNSANASISLVRAVPSILVAVLCPLALPLNAADSWQFAFENGRPVRLQWNTVSGQNYDLFASDDLREWTHIEGFPLAGSGAPLVHGFSPGLKGFFRIMPTSAPVGEFVYIPAGEFQMGDANSGGLYDELPVHRVSLNACYVSRFELTKGLWDEVQQWGLGHGYPDLPAGCLDANGVDYSKGPGHPVFNVTWSEAVKWCNARSERDGLRPCYYRDAEWKVVFRTGSADVSASMVNWQANGYRLPTEAEWERAARGGASGRVYPWGNTISYTNANYSGHPLYSGTTAAVESFEPNGYGLFNVTGNVAEMCWDIYLDDRYSHDHTLPPMLDPRGGVSPATGDRVFRGGDWAATDWVCRTASRSSYHTGHSEPSLGLRLVRTAVEELFVKIDNGQPSLPLPHPIPAVPVFSVTLGRTSRDVMADAPPVAVNLQFFHIGKYEVTWRLWEHVRTWAETHGYPDLSVGGGKGARHPVVAVSWYATLKWCNARSEMNGLSPCYRQAGAIYRSGAIDGVTCDWNANGYRLPTEAEWEAAARGGEAGRRFPLGDTITHSDANYTSNEFFSYDLSTTRGRHPAYQDGVTPFTAPVGSFPPNSFGLYDMAGNAWERCWDWYQSDYYTSGVSNPRGPVSGSLRVSRGGGWSYYADLCRCAARDKNPPGETPNGHGFRLARSVTAVP